MEAREFLNTKEGFAEIIDDMQLFIEDLSNKILSIKEDEKKGIKRYPKPNLEIITATRHTIFSYLFGNHFLNVFCRISNW